MNNADTEGYYADYFVSNPYKEPITILCDTAEFNRVKLLPNQTIRIPIYLNKGLRPWTRESTLRGKRVTWIGAIDVDAPNI
jgi:hypothetical protein